MPRYRSRRSRKRKRYSRKKRSFKRKRYSSTRRTTPANMFKPKFRRMDFPSELRTIVHWKQNGHIINAASYSYQICDLASLYDPMWTNSAFPDLATQAYYWLLTSIGPYTKYYVTKATITFSIMNQGSEPVNYWLAAAKEATEIDSALEIENRPGVKWGQLPAHGAQTKPTHVSMTVRPRQIHPRAPILDLCGAYNSSPTENAFVNLFVEYADGVTTGIEVNARISIKFHCQLFDRVYGVGY